MTQYVHRVWTFEQGLPQDSVRWFVALCVVLVHSKPRCVADELVESHLLRIAGGGDERAPPRPRENIEILLDYESGRIRLAIRDDGHGSGQLSLDQLAAMSHGLRGMRERADEIGARFVIRNNGARAQGSRGRWRREGEGGLTGPASGVTGRMSNRLNTTSC